MTLVYLILFLMLATLGIVFCFYSLLGFLRLEAPFIPIPNKVIKDIVQALELQKTSIMYDLGSGDGRVLLVCAEQGGSYIGIEKSRLPYFISKIRVAFSKHKNISVKRADMFKTDLKSATHVFSYLLPRMVERLEPKLLRELSPGTRFVTCDFKLKNKQPDRIIHLDRPTYALGKTLYVYIF